ncbi:MAG: translation elongation factor 4 [Patescibacteria group bacterium]|jgi:GTP-binding protein LepA
MDQKNIRNFCIIAHIDHGKSTLADRFLEITHTIEKRDLKEQTLDSLDLEREKGITIKLKAVCMSYELSGQRYQLNLIDTPGHVDFSYEVSRSLAACEGAILVVDATQGIEAQTVSNVYKAKEAGLKIIPVLNKIDILQNEAERIAADMVKTFGFAKEEILGVSAKTGQGVPELLEQIIARVPAPSGDENSPLRALVFDTFYDDFLGVMAAVRIVDGSLRTGALALKLLASKTQFDLLEIGIFIPKRRKANALQAGEVGYVATGLKDIHSVKVGDTLSTDFGVAALPGYKEIRPFVFVSIFPVDNDAYPALRDALEKLSLSDSSLQFEPESSSALGFGFRCGFLGLLHADVVQERLEREYNLNLISTTPSVAYKVMMTNGNEVTLKRPSELPDPTQITEIQEPWILLNIVSPAKYVGGIITLCEERRGIMQKMGYPTEDRAVFEYKLPLNELVLNFFDDLKTISSGFASLDYEFLGYEKVDAVRLDILVHGKMVEPFSSIVVKDKAVEIGKELILKLKDVIPRQQFKVSLQAAIGGKILAREDIPAMRKDVLAKMSGGHRERKDKLLDIQKEGKKRMKKLGSVDIPQEAFRQVLSR